jgi:hypothetical protein
MVGSSLKARVFDEPMLEFGDSGQHCDSRQGLREFGPLQPRSDDVVRTRGPPYVVSRLHSLAQGDVEPDMPCEGTMFGGRSTAAGVRGVSEGPFRPDDGRRSSQNPRP